MIKKLQDAISQNNITECIFIIDKSKEDMSSLLVEIRNKGVFRASKYDFHFDVIKKTIDYILETCNLSDKENKYLHSILNLFHIGFSIKSDFKVINSLSSNIKEYIAVIEYLFILKASGVVFPFAEAERYAECISTIYFNHKEKETVEQNHILRLDKRKLKELSDNVDRICRVNTYQELEVKIDIFEFTATRKKSKIFVEGELQKYIKMGYILSEAGRFFNVYRLFKDGDFSEDDLKLERKVCELVSYSFRLTEKMGVKIFQAMFAFPFFILKTIIRFLRYDGFYAFEKIELLSICKELHVLKKESFHREIVDDIAVKEIVKFMRIFRLFSQAFVLFLKREYGEDFMNKDDIRKIIYESCVIVNKYDEFKRMVSIFLGVNKSDSIIKMFTWDNSLGARFDFQTHPIIQEGEILYIAPALISGSFLLRNTMHARKFRYDSSNAETPIEDQLEECSKNGFVFIKDMEYRFNNKKGDIDAIIIIDEHMFVFECKNSLPPSDIYQLKQSYDYIIKADDQLSRFKKYYTTDDGFKAYFLQKVRQKSHNPHIKISGFTTAIVMGNRMFSGYMINDNLVVNIFELKRFINEGSMTRNDEKISLWKGAILAKEDLIWYLGKESYIVKRTDDLTRISRTTKIKGKELIEEDYVLIPPNDEDEN